MSGYVFGVRSTSEKTNVIDEWLALLKEYRGKSDTELDRIISDSKEGTDEWYYARAYRDNNLRNLSEIYYPTLQIEGFTLYRAEIGEWTVGYYYAPNEALQSEDYYRFSVSEGIRIGVARTHWIDTADPLSALIRQFENQKAEYILKDGLLYREGYRSINGLVGNTRFTLYLPKSICSKEKLFSIAKQFAETAESVCLE